MSKFSWMVSPSHIFRGIEMLVAVDKQGREYNWWVGTPKVEDLEVSKVQADGDELMMILTKIQNIPTAPMKSVVVWSGDIAQFVYDNALT